MRKMGFTVDRTAWEGADNSLNAIVAIAQSMVADASSNPTLDPLKMFVTLDVSTIDISTGVTFTTEQLAYNYGFTAGAHVATALAPYASTIIGLGCGNEMTRKDGVMSQTNVMGTTRGYFVTAKWKIFRGVQAGVLAGIKSVTTAIKAFSNAWTFAEIAAPIMLRDNVNPDGTAGTGAVVYDGQDFHSYHAWNNPFMAPDDTHSGWVPFFNYVEQLCIQFNNNPIFCSEFNADADSQADVDMAAWLSKVLVDFYNHRFDYNLVGICYYAMYNADYIWGCFDSSNNLIATRGQVLKKFIAANPDADPTSITGRAMAILNKFGPGNARLYLPGRHIFSDAAGTTAPVNGAGCQLLPDILGNVAGATDATQSTSPPTFQASPAGIILNGSEYLITNAFMQPSDDFLVVVGCTPSGTAPALNAGASPVTLSATNAASHYGRIGALMFSTAGVTAEWYGDTGGDYQATWAYPNGTYNTARVVSSRKKGNTGSVRINGTEQATVDLSTFSQAFAPTCGRWGSQYTNDTGRWGGTVFAALAVKTAAGYQLSISDADALVLEQFVNLFTNTGVNFDGGSGSSGSGTTPPTTSALTATGNGTSTPASGTNRIEADTVSADSTRIFENGADFALNITTRAPTADTLNYTIYDAEDNVMTTGSFAVPNTPRTTTLKVNSTQAGYFRIKCALQSAGGGIVTNGTAPAGFVTFGVKTALTSVLPAPTYVRQDQHRFGMQGFNDNGPVLRALGITQTLDDRDWSTMEPSTDNSFVASAANGDQFYYSNRDIMRLVRGDGVPDRYLPSGAAGQRDSWCPTNLTAFQSYWGRVGTETGRLRTTYYSTQQYNYYQPTWEPDVTWLDTDANFIKMQKAFYNGVHSTDTKAIVMGPTDSFITATKGHLDRLYALDNTYWNYVDGISTHGYYDAGCFPTHRPEQRGASTDPDTALNGMAQAYNTLRTLMYTRKGAGLKLFQTEMGIGYEFDMDYGDTRINPNYLYAHGVTVLVGATISLGEGVDVHYPFFGGDFTKEDNGEAGYGVFFSLDPARTPDYPIPNISPKPAAMALHACSAILDGTTTLGRDHQFDPTDAGIHAYWHQRIGGGKCILEAHTFSDSKWQLGTFNNTYTRVATFNVDSAGTSGTVPVIDWMGNVTLMAYTNGQLSLPLKQHPQYVVVSNITVAKAQATAPVGYTAAN